uniref:Cystatin domain-containing protein n=1 Tax=Globodera pallida TaxID=36090 RepID=A0A183BY64_GLOPA
MMYSSRHSLASHFALTVLLASTLLLPVDGESTLCNAQRPLNVDDKLIKLGIEEARKTVFEAINAYNDAKTGEAVRAAVLQVRAVVNNGGEAAKAAVSSTDLTNEY